MLHYDFRCAPPDPHVARARRPGDSRQRRPGGRRCELRAHRRPLQSVEMKAALRDGVWVRVIGLLIAGVLMLVLGYGGVASGAGGRASHVSVVASVTAGGRVSARVWPGSGVGRVTAVLEQLRGGRWLTRASRRIPRERWSTISFAAPLQRRSFAVRVELLRGPRVVWRSRKMRVVIRASGSPGSSACPAGQTGRPPNCQPPPPNPNRGAALNPGQTLEPGWYLASSNGAYKLVMQSSDGTLVLYQGAQPLWSSSGQGAGASVTMQGDGNLVIYNGGSRSGARTRAGSPARS